MSPTHLTKKALSRPSETLLLSLAASLLLRRCAGEDVDRELARLAHLKGYKETAPRVVQEVLTRLLTKTHSSGAVGPIGYPGSEAEFRKLSARCSPLVAAQLALVPDGPLWGRTSGVIIPLCYEAMSALGVSPRVETLAQFVRAGADFRKRELLYERVTDMGSGVWCEEPTRVPGFDAIELTDSHVLVHHYMGVRWQAPLLFEDGLNAFNFLEQMDASWAEVQRSVGAESWRRLAEMRASRPTLHRVSIDPENAMEDAASTERARQRYGVELEVVGFLEA